MRTVLIVDDSAAMRAVVKQSLSEAGFGVIEAANPEEASGKLFACETENEFVQLSRN